MAGHILHKAEQETVTRPKKLYVSIPCNRVDEVEKRLKVIFEEELNETNLKALEAGLPNLLKHVENITGVFKLPAVVAINEFPTDTEEEINLIKEKCNDLGVNVVLSQVWAHTCIFLNLCIFIFFLFKW